MIVRKSAREIEAMREAGRIVGRAHAAIRERAAVGATTAELDAVADRVLTEHGATSPFRGYHPHFAPSPFPAVICASVNDVIVHGFPTDEPLADGDLVSIDLGAILDGWVGDAAASFIVGEARPADQLLIDRTTAALYAGIEAAQPGNRLGDIADAVGSLGRLHGYGLPEGWGGHGIGREMHEDPSVPNEGRPGRGLRLKPGLAIAIEPMFIGGGDDAFSVDDDGWTIRTADGSRAAHQEHTIAITADGPRILTEP